MHQIKEMLKKMGFEIVVDEMKTAELTENDGFFVAKRWGFSIFYRVDYTVDSYGNEPSITSVREVKPKEVTKVEYI